MKHKFLSTQNMYIVLSILLPVLSIYASPVRGLDFGTACVLLLALVMFFNKPFVRMNPFLTILLAYSFLVSIPAIADVATNYSAEGNVLFRVMRFIIVMLMMIGIGHATYFNERKYTKVLKVVSLFVAGYAILQSVVFKISGIKLRNLFGQERGGAVFSATLGEYENVYRPPSFFLEPSGVAYFLTPFLCYILFHQKKLEKRDLLVAIVVTAGMLVTTSGQALLVVALCWGIWGAMQLKSKNFGGVLIVLVCAVLFVKNFDVGYTISRITTDEELNALDARSTGYDMVKEMPSVKLLFGNGYGNYDDTIYYSSFADIIFCTGIIGLLLVLFFYLMLFVKGNFYQRVLVLASLVLMIGGGIYTATYLCLYLPLLLPRVRIRMKTSLYES